MFKRKYIGVIDYIFKKIKIYNKNKRKFRVIVNESSKKGKCEYICLIHTEKYICDIYECKGQLLYRIENFMSYIN